MNRTPGFGNSQKRVRGRDSFSSQDSRNISNGKRSQRYERQRGASFDYASRGESDDSFEYSSNGARRSNRASGSEYGSSRTYSRRAAGGAYVDQRRKRTRKKRIIIAVVATIAVLLVAAIVVAAVYINSVTSRLKSGIDDNVIAALATDSAQAGDPFYMLLLGVDMTEARLAGREEGGNTSDTMILARIDPEKKTATLISIHRDIKVNIPGHGVHKINAAYSLGGPELAITMAEQLTGVDISHYVEVNIDGLSTVVESLGGVTVDVPISFYDPYLDDGLEAGTQTLNGWKALVFCRARHAFDDLGDGDRYRAEHQKIFLKALAKQLLKADAATMATTISSLADCINTDMDIGDIVSLAQSMRGMDTDNGIYTGMTPTQGVYENSTWYEQLDEREFASMMKRVEAGLPPTDDSALDVSVLNGSGITGAAASAASKLETAGYMTTTGDAKSSYAQTTIVYNTGDLDAANAILGLLGKGVVEENDGSYDFDGDILVVVGSDWR